MRFAEALVGTQELVGPLVVDRFRAAIPVHWLETALDGRAKKATVRRRRLPPEQVAWAVIGAALFRNKSIVDVVDHLELALADERDTAVAASSVHEARAALGPEPLAHLFSMTGSEWAYASAKRNAYRGLSLFGVDGSAVRVPDSVANRERFGAHFNGTAAAYPQLRLMVLMALGSHLLADAAFGPVGQGELTLAKQLWDRLPEQSLVLADALYANPGTFLPLRMGSDSRHFLMRAQERTRARLVEVVGEGDELVELDVDRQARAENPMLPERIVLRVLHYRRKGFPAARLITSLLDPVAYPADELVALYHRRWELELGYDELKTEMLEREEALRCLSPDAVDQEVWGLLLAYNLVRFEMERVALEANVAPTQISFRAALHLIRDELRFYAIMRSPGALPRHIRNLESELKRLVLPARRPERTYPRAVKATLRKYPTKRRP